MQDTVNILIVDDEPRNLDALESVLDDPGYRVIRASDADTALKRLLENDVAVIVLDIKMPGVSGLELAQVIKGSKKFRQIPIVFLTAHLVDDKDVITGYGAGAVDYITKPINPQILRAKVAVFAELFRKTRALARLNDTLERRVQERTAELERSEQALREAMRQKDLFLATLAHELRNPLAPLRSGLEVLLMQHERSSLIDRTLGAMNRQLSHMVRLIDDLLDVSRISRGTLEVRRERADLASVIERAVETVNPCFVARQQTVAIEAEAPIRAWIDATRIAQIVANLLNNASRYSPAGSRIRVRLRREGELAVVQVIDPGAGIPEEQLGRLFGMFTKIERVNGTNGGSSDGLGIGLALSRQLAELHGGTLTAESAGEGKGATFTLAIPIGHAELVAWGVEEEEGSAPPRSSRRAGLHVVVVEDNTDTADMMSVWLAELGHEVKVARTGPDGVALILEAHPDVVLCDIGLPGMDGVDVCKHVVGEMTTPPVMIALTGWGMETDRRRTVQAGFHHHLVKPVEPDELLRVLDSVRTAATRMRADA